MGRVKFRLLFHAPKLLRKVCCPNPPRKQVHLKATLCNLLQFIRHTFVRRCVFLLSTTSRLKHFSKSKFKSFPQPDRNNMKQPISFNNGLSCGTLTIHHVLPDKKDSQKHVVISAAGRNWRKSNRKFRSCFKGRI